MIVYMYNAVYVTQTAFSCTNDFYENHLEQAGGQKV